ncbi:cation-translocating P-type ATPase [Lacrimispora xylanolytica]|uniref:Cation-translocating P-type ATPase n=1 Tax=Lacrimispora xylanolytica TaxID=29375 RepID=A0ABY7ABF6_9FIRM|nr:cation-translocating P-type ATPase [Lacrimispora xylanolytica]WAJ23906.1 cation-translocating P-type ATPase [Lacrimispora xylanolytica]
MENWYEASVSKTLQHFNANENTGLSENEAVNRQKTYGKNEFDKLEKTSLIKDILHHLKDISTIILLLAALLSLGMALKDGHGFIEPVVIVSIVILNLVLAITQERSAEKALEALTSLNSPDCIVLRDGVQKEMDTTELVPGDIILLQLGSIVPADARLITSTNLQVDESALTGESEPSEKNADLLLQGTVPLGDQLNMVFSGCHVTSGHGVAVVTGTGMHSEMGKIAGYLNNSQKIKTPLQRRLEKVAKSISMIAIIAAVLLLVIGLLQGESFWSMVTLAATLAVAAVPETLNLIVTLSLSQGVKNMVNKNALIRKLSAVETLGNTSVICSDKTGTLTQNLMTIEKLWLPGEEPFGAEEEFGQKEKELLTRFALASNATVQMENDGTMTIMGNPTEKAIMRLLHEKGLSKQSISEQFRLVGEIPFSSERKMMTIVLEDTSGGYIILTKGALDRLPLHKFDERMEEAVSHVHELFAKEALRVLALGIRHVDEMPDMDRPEEIERELTLCGLIGLIDPARPEAAQAVERAKMAGIRTIMITGDHAVTASAIAKNIGILGENEKVLTGQQLKDMSDEELCRDIHHYSVYARVSPEDKIRIVEAWQENGEVVSMTGDGVNDTPALKAADVGVSMGRTGTEVAKSASDMVLTDDNFATIIDAVSEGRNVYSNIRKTIYFLLVCNISEIVIMLVAQLRGWGIPVTPIMLLLVNVLGDGIPGLYLARERSDPRLMDREPIRRDEGFLSGGLLTVIIQQTIACSAVVLIGYYIGTFRVLPGNLGPSQAVGQTVAFLILGWTSILHLFTVRSRKSIFKRTLRDNPPVVYSTMAMIAVFSFLAAVPSVGKIFDLTAIGGYHWLIAAGLSLIPTIVAEIGKFIDNQTNIREIREYRHRVIRHKIRRDDSF